MAKQDKQPKADWLAFILGPCGGGSWARGSERGDTLRRALWIYKADWSSLFELRGAEVVVNVVEVTGHERITFGSAGVFAGDYGHAPRIARKIEHVHHVYPGKAPKRRAS